VSWPAHLPCRRWAARGLSLAGAGGVSVALAACGVSHTASASGGGKRGGGSRQGESRQATSNGVCRTVARPRPKGVQHLAKPRLRLDPSKTYVVRLTTNCGEIDVKLDVGHAPAVAASFVYLVNLGFYDDLTFHRVVSGFVIQGGDPNGNGSGGPGYTVTEPPPESERYTRGTVAMAKAASDPPGTAGSQFFIVTGENVDLPPQYAVLGKVVGGVKTVSAISQVPTIASPDGEDSAPSKPVVISSAKLERR
jgi:cyclophilin family peptidyl-prolyl cis-trans isomerase